MCLNHPELVHKHPTHLASYQHPLQQGVTPGYKRDVRSIVQAGLSNSLDVSRDISNNLC